MIDNGVFLPPSQFEAWFLSTVISKKDLKNIEKAIEFAKEWLKSIGGKNTIVTTKECRFCHTQSVSEEIEIDIMTDGYFIAKMEGCPK